MIKRVVLILIVILFIVITIQGTPLYKLWHAASSIQKGQSRGEVIAILGVPTQEWAKASNLDIWIGKLLLGGVRLDISYSGTNCGWKSPTKASDSCFVESINKNYYTLWGNTWFLAYAPQQPNE